MPITPTFLNRIYTELMISIYENLVYAPKHEFVIVKKDGEHSEVWSLYTKNKHLRTEKFSIDNVRESISSNKAFSKAPYFNWRKIGTDNNEYTVYLFISENSSTLPPFHQVLNEEFFNWIKREGASDSVPALSHLKCIAKAAERLIKTKTDDWFLDYYVKVITEISSHYYEKSESKGVIAFVPSDLDLESLQGILLKNTLRFNLYDGRSLRKMLQMSSSEHPLIVHRGGVIGYSNPNKADVECHIDGHMSWSLIINDEEFIKFKHGRYIVPKKMIDASYVAGLIKGTFDTSDDACRNIANLALLATNQKHGTALLISNNAKEEVKRLASYNRCNPISPVDICADHDLVEHITSVDGCIVVDEKGICHGIAALLDGESSIRGQIGRGSRYNSLRNYVTWRYKKNKDEKNMVFIISEDRTVDFFSTNDILLNKFEPGAIIEEEDWSGADLAGVNLRKARLKSTSFSSANLSGANLSFANLSGADLSDADLRNSNLRNANLEFASLKNAILVGADLEGANLNGCDLTGTVLA